jgi:creatinine amidohydrolase
VLNSHGGNSAPLATALAEVGAECTRRGALVAGASYWSICGAAWRREIPELALSEMGHACEIETSLMGVARPDLPPGSLPADSPYPDFLREGWGLAVSFAALTPEGAIGFPRQASVEKGRKLFAIAVRELGRFFADFSARPFPRDLRIEEKP